MIFLLPGSTLHEIRETVYDGCQTTTQISTGQTRSRSTERADSRRISKADLDDEESNQGLFDDLLSGEPIFENKEVLRPSYTPHELPHRSDQINKMATILVAALRGRNAVRTSSSTGRPGPAKPQARNSSARNSRAPRRSTASRVTSSTSTARSPIRSIAYSHNSRTSSSKRTKSGSTNALRNSNRCSRPSTVRCRSGGPRT